MEELERHNYKVSPGIIYPTLHNLERKELLTGNNRVVEGKVWRYYRITEEGSKILEESKKDKRANGGDI